MAPRSLARKFSLAIALVVIASVGAMSVLAVATSRRSLRDQTLAANLAAATLAARAIEQYVADAASIMREAPGRPKLGHEIRSGNWPEATKVLDNFLRHFPQFDYVFVQDPQGVIRIRVPSAPTVGPDFSFREFFQDVLTQAAERCARIIKSFLALARQHAPERKRVELNRVVEDALELLGYHLRVENVEVVRDLASDVPPLWADGHQLHQVVINLVTNAVQAMRRDSGARRLTLTTRHDPTTGQARLEVADTGPGIPPEIQARMFEPFFTTKPPGEGTGLGLALCQGIVDGHGGRIGLETQLGQGTVFRIDLPILTPSGVVTPSPGTERPPVRGRSILVVDDEHDVADVLAEILGADGHRVDTVGSGAQAVDRLGASAYDLIISDVRMPGLDGPGLYRELERRHPALLPRIVFLTGDTLTPHIREFLRVAGRPEIVKPFSVADVRCVVQEALRHDGSIP